MKINGLDNITGAELTAELDKGAKFVIYQYCISILIMTFRRPSEVYFIRSGESAITKGLGFTALSLTLGWWGIPWGPIYTIGSLITNFGGGKDVTEAVVQSLSQPQV